MIRPIVLIISALSLLSFTHAAALDAREDDRKFICPEQLGDDVLRVAQRFDETFTCSYFGQTSYMCIYDDVGRALHRDAGPDLHHLSGYRKIQRR
jgi:hypothetical protein